MTDKQHCLLSETIQTGRAGYHFIMVALEGGVLMIGASMKPGVNARIRIDDHVAVETTQCDSSMCYFAPKETAIVISQMRKGNRLLVDFRGLHGEIGPLGTSLSGFDEAYHRMVR
jgi:invasion protein IalB